MGFRRRWLILAGLCAWLLPVTTGSAAVTVILVRHAEKAASPAADPPLTQEGNRRAKALAETLRTAGVTAIYETEYLRTQQTAAPTAALLHLPPKRIDGKKSSDLVQAIRQHKEGVILVVGHSNTVPEVISGLGGPAVSIDDADYDSLFVLTIAGPDVTFLRLHYGDAVGASRDGKPNGPMLAPIVGK